MCDRTQSTMVGVDDGKADGQSIRQTVRWRRLQLLLRLIHHLHESTHFYLFVDRKSLRCIIFVKKINSAYHSDAISILIMEHYQF